MSRQGRRAGGQRPREHLPEAPVIDEPPTGAFPSSSSSINIGSGTGFGDAHPSSSIHPSHPSGRLDLNVQHSSSSKIAIPALRSTQASDSQPNRKGRTQHACDACRKAKAGCTGGVACTRCHAMRLTCVYGDGKREKDKKKMTSLSDEKHGLIQRTSEVMVALRRIRCDLDLSLEDMRAAIDEVLSMNTSPGDEFSSPLQSRRQQPLDPEDGNDGGAGEAQAAADVGSPRSIDVVSIDTDQVETRGIGYLGKLSSVTWPHRPEDAATLSTYHAEEIDMDYFDTSSVSMYSWPPAEVAATLIQSYFDHVHDFFPIINKRDFMSKYNIFPRNATNLRNDEIIWLSTLNAVFAISATHCRLMASSHLGHFYEHLIYCARSTMLCANQKVYLQDSRVASTSTLGLLSLYYLCNNRLNRAWTMCGLAMRHALALGLHVRSIAKEISDADKEYRVRLWWSLYSLEWSLSVLTGRPTCITDRDISNTIPVNVEEAELYGEQALYNRMEDVQSDPRGPLSSTDSRNSRGSNIYPAATYQMPSTFTRPNSLDFPAVSMPLTSSTFFIYRTQLSIISHEIITELYCAAVVKGKWLDIENTISRIDKRLVRWACSLPSTLSVDFDTYNKPDFNDPNTVQRTALALLYNSSRMILFRPCLCHSDGTILGQSERSKNFDQESVRKCVHSARRTITLLSWFASTPSKFYALPLFWNNLNCLCEALSVLILEMEFKGQHLPDEIAEILEDAKKGIRWLVMMSEQSIGARKAWEMFDRLIRMVALGIRWSVYDLPTEAPVPPGYNYPKYATSDQTCGVQPDIQQQHQAPLQPSLISGSHVLQFSSPYPQSTTPLQFSLAPNPLEPSVAMERFLSIRQIHGQYDDPWQHPFNHPGRDVEAVRPAPPADPNLMQIDGPGGNSGTYQERTFGESLYGAPRWHSDATSSSSGGDSRQGYDTFGGGRH